MTKLCQSCDEDTNIEIIKLHKINLKKLVGCKEELKARKRTKRERKKPKIVSKKKELEK